MSGSKKKKGRAKSKERKKGEKEREREREREEKIRVMQLLSPAASLHSLQREAWQCLILSFSLSTMLFFQVTLDLEAQSIFKNSSFEQRRQKSNFDLQVTQTFIYWNTQGEGEKERKKRKWKLE